MRAMTSAQVAPPRLTMKFACLLETSAPPMRMPLQPAVSISRARKVARWIAKDAARVWQLERLSRVSAVNVFAQTCLHGRLVARLQFQFRETHDGRAIERRAAVGKFWKGQGLHVFAGHHDLDAAHERTDFDLGSRVHANCSTDRPRYSDERFGAFEPCLRCFPTQRNDRSRTTGSHDVSIDGNAREVADETDNDAGKALVAHHNVAAKTKNGPGDSLRAAQMQQGHEVFGIRNADICRRVAAHSHGGLGSHRFVEADRIAKHGSQPIAVRCAYRQTWNR